MPRRPVSRQLSFSFDTARALCKALGHPLRQGVLVELRGGSKDVSTLARRLRATTPLMSRSLTLLRARGLVVVKPRGRWRIYSLSQGVSITKNRRGTRISVSARDGTVVILQTSERR